jgi:hypothetical protein
MPGHIGTDIVNNSRRVHGGADPDDMTEAELAEMREELVRQGMPVAGVTDDQLRLGIKMMGDGFRDNAPVSAAQAATIILDGVRNDSWRILVGQDAVALDEAVRADPLAAYSGAMSLPTVLGQG